ncbi:MAG: HEAT repeat domain-containing protein [Planctomycetes bacterium]|nr:HEAT repeat domain-containing protein [Planctomycetota bacterium]
MRPHPLLATSFALAAAFPASAQSIPDLTRGDPIPQGAVHDWTLGATGARGWMHSAKMTTTQARQVAITDVERGSPADGILARGDVLLGIGKARFARDPRTELGAALTAAESAAGAGRLDLIRWRAGATETVTVRLPVLGSYAPTAPFDCPKSKAILDRGCRALARRMAEPRYRPNPIPRCLNALALLASGNRDYLPLIEREARWAAKFSVKSFQTWYYGYVLILLAEYHGATGDGSILEGMRRLALEAARGQSRVGSWGHRFAEPSGRLAGYGMMNAPGVPLTIGLVLARDAGVREPVVAQAIERSVALLRFYIGKGAIPYGDHDPWILTHEDNGKCGMGTVLFDLCGDRRGTEFFSRMSLASHGSERDTGHTGNYFNMLWALPAIARAGPHATGAWMAEFGANYLDLARRWDGTFRHQGPPQERHDSYRGWDATGAFLLAYALPLRKTVITGKRRASIPELDRDSATAVVACGRGWDNRERFRFYAGLSDGALLRRLGSWSPVVRERAAIALGRRRATAVPALCGMLGGAGLTPRLGACRALAQLGRAAAPAVPTLRAVLDTPHPWLRIQAAEALARIGPPAMSTVPKLLEMLTNPPRDGDPRGMEQRYLCFALFDRRRGMLRRSLEGVDRDQLYRAVRAGLSNQDGRARGTLGTVYETLSLSELRPLLPAIHRAIRESAPSGIMFAHEIRMAGLRLLAKHHVREGIAACAWYVRHQKQHGSQKRVPQILALLRRYGAHAREVIPELRQTAAFFTEQEQNFPKPMSRQKAQAVLDAVREIEATEDRPALISIDDPATEVRKGR